MAEWIMLGVLAGFSVYDLRWKKVNVSAVALFGIAVIAYRIYGKTAIPELLAGLIPGIGLLLISFVTKESIGTGDGLVLCVIGMFCGMKQTAAVLGMALILSAVLAMVLLVCKRAGKKTELPFLPCLCAGYFLFLLW